MISLPNFISLLRLPMAFVFLHASPLYRSIALLIAMLSDGLDGFLARRWRMTSQVGAFLDPIMDKFFVLFIAVIFMQEGKLDWTEIAMLICRDFSVLLFGTYLLLTGQLYNYRFRSIICGKLSTLLQFLVLFALTLNITPPLWIYSLFIVIGLMALVELALTYRTAES